MGKITKITCDGCNRDLTTRSNSVDYRLVLGAESKPGHGGGAYTDMMIYPPVDRTYYFCDLWCLDHWRGRENYQNQLWEKDHEIWREEHCTGRRHDGGVLSYAPPPREIQEARKAEYEAAALTAFPMERPKRNHKL